MSFEKLDVDMISEGLGTKIVGSDVVVFKSTSSTNDIAWEYSGNEANNGLVVFSEQQSKGRGRMGNKWLSKSGQSLLLSVVLTKSEVRSQLLTLGCAVAIAEAMQNCCGVEPRIKWPNDIIIAGKKAAGILLESRIGKGKSDYVIGIGINCHQNEAFFAKQKLQMPGTSIDIESKKVIDRNELARELLGNLDKWIEIAGGGGESILERWKQLSSQIGHRITVEFNKQRFAGNCIGVDPVKGIILQLENGGVRMFEAAQTTIVKHL
jgi:BirA family biotin operon repressor/biotin-[acetyl-CoA-carboxylase] ligase